MSKKEEEKNKKIVFCVEHALATDNDEMLFKLAELLKRRAHFIVTAKEIVGDSFYDNQNL